MNEEEWMALKWFVWRGDEEAVLLVVKCFLARIKEDIAKGNK